MSPPGQKCLRPLYIIHGPWELLLDLQAKENSTDSWWIQFAHINVAVLTLKKGPWMREGPGDRHGKGEARVGEFGDQ